MSVELTEALLQKAAGWDVVKRARAYLELGGAEFVLAAAPAARGRPERRRPLPRLNGHQERLISRTSAPVARRARWNKICATASRWLCIGSGTETETCRAGRATAGGRGSPEPLVSNLAPPKASSLQRAATGEPAELFLILPPNFDQAIARGKVMVVFEAKWGGGRGPLNALPKGRAFKFSEQDNAIVERLEVLADGETLALLQLDAKDFAALLPLLADHENITLSKTSSVKVTRTPFQLPLRVTGGEREIIFTLKERLARFPLWAIGSAESRRCSRSACRPAHRAFCKRRCAPGRKCQCS